MTDRITLIEAPRRTQKLGHTIAYSPILREEGQIIVRYELVLEADFIPCGCTYAADPSEFQECSFAYFSRQTIANIVKRHHVSLSTM